MHDFSVSGKKGITEFLKIILKNNNTHILAVLNWWTVSLIKCWKWTHVKRKIHGRMFPMWNQRVGLERWGRSLIWRVKYRHVIWPPKFIQHNFLAKVKSSRNISRAGKKGSEPWRLSYMIDFEVEYFVYSRSDCVSNIS